MLRAGSTTAQLSEEQRQTLIRLFKERASDLGQLEQKMKYSFKDRGFLFEALTHSSAVRGNLVDNEILDTGVELPWNERFEFLGDAVLGLAISTFLTVRPEGFPEGELSKIRASLVNENMLADLGNGISLGDYLLLGRGEERSDGRLKPSIIADAFEALIGAVYLDGGFNEAARVIKNLFGESILGELQGYTVLDFKSMLQEVTQEQFKEVPIYKVVAQSGPAHARSFEVSVSINGQVVSVGEGVSKKKASQVAAELAFEKLARGRADD